MILFVKQKFGR